MRAGAEALGTVYKAKANWCQQAPVGGCRVNLCWAGINPPLLLTCSVSTSSSSGFLLAGSCPSGCPSWVCFILLDAPATGNLTLLFMDCKGSLKAAATQMAHSSYSAPANVLPAFSWFWHRRGHCRFGTAREQTQAQSCGVAPRSSCTDFLWMKFSTDECK